MGLAQSMYTGATGLRAHQTRLDVISHNFSNTNTTAYKRDSHQFKDIFSLTLNGATGEQENIGATNGIRVGQGVVTGSIDKVYTQGPLETTNNPLNMAIAGEGFFVTRLGGDGSDYYTRDGNFYISENTLGTAPDGQPYPRQLYAANGMEVMGYNAVDGTLPATSDLEGVKIPLGEEMAGRVTSEVIMGGNLNAVSGVVEGNSIATGVGTTWDTDNGSTINVGHVETSAALWDSNLGAAATAATDLADLQYFNGGGLADAFNSPVAGDSIDITFDRGGQTRTATFIYGTSGTTLGDLSTFLAGGLGDDGTAATDRLDGGALGTIRTSERTTDGYNVAAEHGGAYLRSYGIADPGAVDYQNADPEVIDPTTRLSIASNLGSSNEISGIKFSHKGLITYDLFSADPDYGDFSSGGSTSKSVTVYDQVGDDVVAKDLHTSFTLVNREGNSSTWRWTVTGTDSNGLADGLPNSVFGTGVVRFDSTVDPATGRPVQTVFYEQDNAVVAEPDALVQSITAGVGDISFDMSGLTQIAVEHSVGAREQNGYADGIMEEFVVAPDSTIVGHYTNGLSRVVSQIALARIPNQMGLESVGENLYMQGAAAGDPIYSESLGIAGVDNNLLGFGLVHGGKLEGSNVDMSTQMTQLITTQRGFQANAKVVSTTDEMLQQLVQLKR